MENEEIYPDLEHYTLFELRQLAKLYNLHNAIQNFSRLKKADLIEKLKKYLHTNINRTQIIATKRPAVNITPFKPRAITPRKRKGKETAKKNKEKRQKRDAEKQRKKREFMEQFRPNFNRKEEKMSYTLDDIIEKEEKKELKTRESPKKKIIPEYDELIIEQEEEQQPQREATNKNLNMRIFQTQTRSPNDINIHPFKVYANLPPAMQKENLPKIIKIADIMTYKFINDIKKRIEETEQIKKNYINYISQLYKLNETSQLSNIDKEKNKKVINNYQKALPELKENIQELSQLYVLLNNLNNNYETTSDIKNLVNIIEEYEKFNKFFLKYKII